MAAVEAQTLVADLEAAIAAGADISDLQALLQERGAIEIVDDAPVVVVEPDEEQEEKRGPLRSIMERVGGVLGQGKLLAEWLLALRNEQLEAQAAARQHSDALVLQAHDWRDKQVERAAKKIAWIDWLLEKFLRECGVAKMDLIGGKPTLTANKPKKVWDEAAALAYALARPDADTLTKRELSKTALNKIIEKRDGKYVLAETGEVVEFVWEEAPLEPYTFAVK